MHYDNRGKAQMISRCPREREARSGQLDSTNYQEGCRCRGKSMKTFGGPEGLRTLDLFHAIYEISITYKDFDLAVSPTIRAPVHFRSTLCNIASASASDYA